MPITPLHFLSKALDHLVATVDSSAAFRAWAAQPEYVWEDLKSLADLGTSPSATSIISKGLVMGGPSLPRCWVLFGDGSTLTQADTDGVDMAGELMLAFEGYAPQTYQTTGDFSEAQVYWNNLIGRIIEEMQTAARSGTGGLLSLDDMFFDEPSVVDLDTHTDGRWRMWSSWRIRFAGNI